VTPPYPYPSSTLQEGNNEAGNGDQADEPRHAHARGTNDSAAGAVSRAGGTASAVEVAVSISVVASAAVRTLDVVLGREGLEGVARSVDITSGRDVKSTIDLLKRGQVDLREVTTDQNGTTNGLQGREAVELLHGGVVGNGETTTNLGEQRHGDVGDLRVADK
ncbi:hypothetical protein C7G77_18525, partial [Acinetobacter baumannii]